MANNENSNVAVNKSTISTTQGLINMTQVCQIMLDNIQAEATVSL